jgi:hypothetical protein
MIHFQHDQEGATLRATDFKPKFDKYIRKKENLKDDELLRYQLKIRALDAPDICEPNKKDGLFFGNLGGSAQKKKELKNNLIELKFNTYFNHSIAKKITNSFHEFLACENFGSRSNKGYGSFFDASKRREDFESFLKSTVAPSSVYFWEYHFNCECQFNDIFFSIKTFYMLLKSGINYPSFRRNPGTYYKSLLFLYMKNKGITWDKKAVKSHFLPRERSHKFETTTKQFVRGLFGVSEIQSWRSYRKTLKVSSTDKTIDRVPSPVMFKVFVDDRNKAYVYFYIKPLESEIFGKKFTFEMNIHKPPLKLTTPSQFDGEDYIAWVVNEINTQLKINTGRGRAHRADNILNNLQQQKIKRL